MHEVSRQPMSLGPPEVATNQKRHLARGEPDGDWWIVYEFEPDEQTERMHRQLHAAHAAEFLATDPESYPTDVCTIARALHALLSGLVT